MTSQMSQQSSSTSTHSLHVADYSTFNAIGRFLEVSLTNVVNQFQVNSVNVKGLSTWVIHVFHNPVHGCFNSVVPRVIDGLLAGFEWKSHVDQLHHLTFVNIQRSCKYNDIILHQIKNNPSSLAERLSSGLQSFFFKSSSLIN